MEEEINITVTRLLSKVRTLAAMSYKISLGHRVIYPRPDLAYCANFLNMMFDSPVKPYQIDGGRGRGPAGLSGFCMPIMSRTAPPRPCGWWEAAG